MYLPGNRLQDLVRLMEARPEEMRPVIDKVYAFDDAMEAFEHLEKQTHIGKIVIKMV